jgi:ABC-type transporter Mla subunit MlaD
MAIDERFIETSASLVHREVASAIDDLSHAKDKLGQIIDTRAAADAGLNELVKVLESVHKQLSGHVDLLRATIPPEWGTGA